MSISNMLSFIFYVEFRYLNIAQPVNVGNSQTLWSALFSVQVLLVLRKLLVICQFNFSSVFLSFSLAAINQQTPESFNNTTESYKVCQWIIQSLSIGSPSG